MLTLSTLVIAALLNGFLTDARFPECSRAYHVDFGNELKGKVIFLSDSEMVYGDLDKKGELRKIDIVKVSAQTFIVVWNEGPENAVRIEHRYDLANHRIRSNTKIAEKQFTLEGEFKITD